MKNYKDFVTEAGRCWKDYKPVPGKKAYSPDSCVKEDALNELTSDLLARYKEKAADQASAADKVGDYTKGNKRFSGIIKATKKQFNNDLKKEDTVVEAAVDAKGLKSSTGGLTQKGRDYYNRKDGGNLKAPVTTPPSKLTPGSKAANRRKSFCARMGGVEGPMKKPNGEPSRKALALRKWNC
jgi:hypothetical protein